MGRKPGPQLIYLNAHYIHFGGLLFLGGGVIISPFSCGDLFPILSSNRFSWVSVPFSWIHETLVGLISTLKLCWLSSFKNVNDLNITFNKTAANSAKNTNTYKENDVLKVDRGVLLSRIQEFVTWQTNKNSDADTFTKSMCEWYPGSCNHNRKVLEGISSLTALIMHLGMKKHFHFKFLLSQF